MILHALTPDGRPAKIKISPQNSLTKRARSRSARFIWATRNCSRDLFRRIAANFGTAIRAYTPD